MKQQKLLLLVLLLFLAMHLKASPIAGTLAVCAHAFKSSLKPLDYLVKKIGNTIDYTTAFRTTEMAFSDDVEESFQKVFDGQDDIETKFKKYFFLFFDEVRNNLSEAERERLNLVVNRSAALQHHNLAQAIKSAGFYSIEDKFLAIAGDLISLDHFTSLIVLSHELGHAHHDITDAKMGLFAAITNFLNEVLPTYRFAQHFFLPYIENKAFGFSWELLSRIPPHYRKQLMDISLSKLKRLDFQIRVSPPDSLDLQRDKPGLDPDINRRKEQSFLLLYMGLSVNTLKIAGKSKKDFVFTLTQYHCYDQATIFYSELQNLVEDRVSLALNIGLILSIFYFIH